MCCNNRQRERWVVALVFLGCLTSLAVATCMIMVTYPGDECLMFVSVRGEALIYGHPAGCRFISAAHIIVIMASLGFCLTLFLCNNRRAPGAGSGAVSNKSLRGSMSVLSVDGIRNKPTVTLIILSVLIMMFVVITTIVIISGYVVTCGELQYETRRKIYGKLSLGTPINNVVITCFSLFRSKDLHTRFHFDHYELSGSWHGQYNTYRHGRPQVWTGSHEHGIDIAAGIELSVASSFLSSCIWMAITIILVLHRRSVKARHRLTVAESIEDQKIWAQDMAAVDAQQQRPPSRSGSKYRGSYRHFSGLHDAAGLHQYEMLARKAGTAQSVSPSVQNPYESLAGSVLNGHVSRQARPPPPPSHHTGPPPAPAPPSDASTYDVGLAHQSVIAHTHPEGSFFLTSQGTYVQLINGVLTNVPPQPVQQVPVQYMQLQFPDQFGPPAAPLAPSQPPSLTQPLMAERGPSPKPSKGSPPPSEPSEPQENTRMNMRRQKDIAAMAGIKCSQF